MQLDEHVVCPVECLDISAGGFKTEQKMQRKMRGRVAESAYRQTYCLIPLP